MSNEITAKEIVDQTNKLRSDWIEIDASLRMRLKMIDLAVGFRFVVDINTEIGIGYMWNRKFCIYFSLKDHDNSNDLSIKQVPLSVLIKSVETLQKAIETIEKEIAIFVQKVAASQQILDQVKLSPLLQPVETKP